MEKNIGWHGDTRLASASERTPLLTASRTVETEPRDQRNSKAHFIIIMLALGFLYLLYAACQASPTPRDDTNCRWQHDAPSYEVAKPSGSTVLNINIKSNTTIRPSIPEDFPDPCVVQGDDGDWYAFATSGNGHKIQMAKAKDPLGQWELIDREAIANQAWTTYRNFWAPDVRRVADGYVMYFSGQEPVTMRHCVGVARSPNITGPYVLDEEAFECPLTQGGAIDPSGFQDVETGKMYVVWKVDGNAVASGPGCGGDLGEEGGTPLMLQEVSPLDGSTRIGDAVAILDRVEEEDGPLVEAPNLVRALDGRFVLFYSTHCFSTPEYDVRYAWADDVRGPYHRAPRLLGTPDFGFEGPGGMTSTVGRNERGLGEVLLLHGRCAEANGGGGGRCLFAVPYGLAVEE
ncbi:hypothetical protein S7711_03727 [Stachybotrys chartarum IBT 7711]|uniref:Glycosyl hydrolase family 43 protein n=1 Tax=Stachybotrys chartarum (strain CBS 109288 / IBT 7711) TaxID=1280523 RepID=A0A084AWR7_STACB|nr:hypothetical protein S7711_03727 [Stachybotrys chartarum IBT 7711]